METERLPRRLAAILYADVAGYSRATSEDEDSTHRTLSSHLNLFAATVTKHHGRVMHYAGDALLAVFDAAVDALRCAMEAQGDFSARNTPLPAASRIEFRIGLNLGDVIEDRGDVYGTGVNVAARLAALAEPGGTCISESLRVAVGSKLPFGFESLGDRDLKNIPGRIRVHRVRSSQHKARRLQAWTRYVLAGAAVLAVAAFAVERFVVDRPGDVAADAVVPAVSTAAPVVAESAADNVKSVAILPFADYSESADNAWLADGLTEEILNSLAQQPELLVTARTSSFQFRSQDRDIRQIGEQLGVAHVVEGSVRRIDNRLRITAQLVRAADGFHLWSDAYDRTTDDLFAVQSDVAEKIATALDIILDDARRLNLRRSGTRNIEAFEAAQRGWAISRSVHGDANERRTLWDANVHFDRALELDAAYVDAALGATDAFVHQLQGSPARWFDGTAYTLDQARERLFQYLDVAATYSSTPGLRTYVELKREIMSPTWHRMRFLVDELEAQWERGESVMERQQNIGDELGILRLAERYDLVRAIATRRLAIDPLDATAWNVSAHAELAVGNLDLAEQIAGEGLRRTGAPVFNDVYLTIDHLRGKRRAVIERLPPRNPLAAALRGDRAGAIERADEIARTAESPPAFLLLVYYEAGATERLRSLAARIDAEPLGSWKLAASVNGLQGLVFDLADTPRFAENARQAGLVLKPRFRLSEMDPDTVQ